MPALLKFCGRDNTSLLEQATVSPTIAVRSDLKKSTTHTTVPSGMVRATNVGAPDRFKDTEGTLQHLPLSLTRPHVEGAGMAQRGKAPKEGTLGGGSRLDVPGFARILRACQ